MASKQGKSVAHNDLEMEEAETRASEPKVRMTPGVKMRKKVKRLVNKSKLNHSKLLRNTSLNSTMVRQTLRTNNRQLARALESTRKELAQLQEQHLELQHHNQHLALRTSRLQRVVGIKDDSIEQEVNIRLKESMGSVRELVKRVVTNLMDTVPLLQEATQLCHGSCRGSSIGVANSTRSSMSSQGNTPEDMAAPLPGRRSVYYLGSPVDHETKLMSKDSAEDVIEETIPPITDILEEAAVQIQASVNSLGIPAVENVARSADLSMIMEVSYLGDGSLPGLQNEDAKPGPMEGRRSRSRSRGNRRAAVDLESLQEFRSTSKDDAETEGIFLKPQRRALRVKRPSKELITGEQNEKEGIIETSVPDIDIEERNDEQKQDESNNEEEITEPIVVEDNEAAETIVVEDNEAANLELVVDRDEEYEKNKSQEGVIRKTGRKRSLSLVRSSRSKSRNRAGGRGRRSSSLSSNKKIDIESNADDKKTSDVPDILLDENVEKNKSKELDQQIENQTAEKKETKRRTSQRIANSPSNRRDTFAIQQKSPSSRRGTFVVLSQSPVGQSSQESSLQNANKAGSPQDKKNKQRRGTFAIPNNISNNTSEETPGKQERRGTFFVSKPVNDHLDVENLLDSVNDVTLVESEEIEKASHAADKDVEETENQDKNCPTVLTLTPVVSLPNQTVLLEEDMELTMPVNFNTLNEKMHDKGIKNGLPSFISPEELHEPDFLKNVNDDEPIFIPKDILEEAKRLSMLEKQADSDENKKTISEEKQANGSETKTQSGDRKDDNWESKLPRPLSRKSKTKASEKIKTSAEEEQNDTEDSKKVDSDNGKNIKPCKVMALMNKPGQITFAAGRKTIEEIMADKRKPRSKSRATLPKQVKSRSKSRSKPRQLPSSPPKPLGEKSVFDMSLTMNESITLLPTTKYSQFRDNYHKSTSDEDREQSAEAVTDSPHGILLVLGNGKRTKPRRSLTKSVSYAEKLEEIVVNTPDEPVRDSLAGDQTPPRGDTVINKEAAGHTPVRLARVERIISVPETPTPDEDIIPPSQNTDTTNRGKKEKKVERLSDFGELFVQSDNEDFKSPGTKKEKISRKEAMHLAMMDTTNLPPGAKAPTLKSLQKTLQSLSKSRSKQRKDTSKKQEEKKKSRSKQKRTTMNDSSSDNDISEEEIQIKKSRSKKRVIIESDSEDNDADIKTKDNKNHRDEENSNANQKNKTRSKPRKNVIQSTCSESSEMEEPCADDIKISQELKPSESAHVKNNNREENVDSSTDCIKDTVSPAEFDIAGKDSLSSEVSKKKEKTKQCEESESEKIIEENDIRDARHKSESEKNDQVSGASTRVSEAFVVLERLDIDIQDHQDKDDEEMDAKQRKRTIKESQIGDDMSEDKQTENAHDFSEIEPDVKKSKKEESKESLTEEPCGRRSRRAAGTVSYAEPKLGSKLRRGDAFTSTIYQGGKQPDLAKSGKGKKKGSGGNRRSALAIITNTNNLTVPERQRPQSLH